MLAAAVDLSRPGHYVHWSIFTVSVANLALVAVMILIFGLALSLPFPGRRHRQPAAGSAGGMTGGVTGPGPEQPAPPPSPDAGMWTNRVRRRLLGWLPPDKLIPDRQPAYVASWIYVFGVASLAALGLAIISGFALAVGGPDWWHTDVVGHFFNSVHLWSVELFMALLVIHLWGKFWMAAWRGRRAATWVTGMLAFLVSVVECFTGYLSQQNFDSQWIATNGKDAFNAAGVGSWFNLMNFGQMLMWHIVLVPLALVLVVAVHVLLVRVRGVAHPLPAKRRGWLASRAEREADARPWSGPMRRYDILKEGAAASLVVVVMVATLAGVLSSPDAPTLTIRTWATAAPADFMATAANELAGTTETAQYGPPYNGGSANVQRLVVSWQTLAGIKRSIDAGRTFVLDPLRKLAPGNASLMGALTSYEAGGSDQQSNWDSAYIKALDQVTFEGATPVVPQADDGPVPTLVASELTLARSGGLDADLVSERPFYGTDFTRPLLFIEDGSYFAAQAQAEHLLGKQWGVMNETGSYPGQPWLWLYQLWYELPGLRSSANVDLIAVYLTGLGTLLLLAVPFIPGLRDIPRLVPVHRLVWRSSPQSPDHEP
ncbi:MAG TPA: cytochrome b N-terminal domain-containing protein [Acidimicrobiales bacterium]|nr:cytochrome b N-terminal domain-containing protein [Acidimicrobiales bacterium]